MKRALLASLTVVLIAGLAWVRGCSGPRPQLVSARMRGPVAEATVRNAGWGEGVIQVDFRRRRRGGGAPLLRSGKAALRPRGTARVEVRVDGARGDEQLDVGLDYPPR